MTYEEALMFVQSNRDEDIMPDDETADEAFVAILCRDPEDWEREDAIRIMEEYLRNLPA